MKKRIFCAALIVMFGAASLCKADDTNCLYATEDFGFNYAEKLEEAERIKESLPAKDFPEGNWGAATNGFQMSLRFGKQVFTNGEPVTAIILVRNVTNTAFAYPVFYVSGLDGPIYFAVETENGEKLSPRPMHSVTASARHKNLGPKTQHKYEECLDARYELKSNAVYFVKAQIIFPPPNAAIIESAKGRIKIDGDPKK